jgi:acyl-CoA thioesterase FadM
MSTDHERTEGAAATTTDAQDGARLLHRMTWRVTLGDVDGARLIYFAAPFGWSERVLSDWMAQEARPLAKLFKDDLAIPVASTKSTFYAPLRQDEVIDLELFTRRIGRSSFTMAVEVRGQSGEVAVAVETVHVYAANTGDGVKPSPLPPWLREPLERGLREEAA